MKTSTTARRQPRRKKSREAVIAAFWDFSSKRDSLKDSDRLRQIEEGLSAYLLQAVRETFDLQGAQFEDAVQCVDLQSRTVWA